MDGAGGGIGAIDAQEARRLFDRAVELQREEREAFLLRECDSPSVRAYVLRLLEAHDDDTGLLLRQPEYAALADIPPVAGRRIGPYLLESEIGRGGMGAVYLASRADDAYRKTVAVKIVPPGIPADLFRRERQIMASLEHPNIARLLDGGTTDEGSPYLVMEFIDGERIDEWANQRDLSTRERLNLVLAVCDAISYAHRSLVVHRDLKPANILVTRDGIPKLLDFGVAKVVAPEASLSQTLPAGLTPEYASPEQIRGETVTTATDVYSFGVVLFELLTRGARPYAPAHNTLPSRLRAILDSKPRRLSSCVDGKLRRELQGELDNIVVKAIAKEPERRYTSIQQLRADIEAYLTGRPVLAQGDGLWYRARKFARRYWLPLGAAAAVLVSSAAGTLGVLRQAHIAGQRRVIAEQASRRAEVLLKTQQQLLAEQVALRGRAEAEAQRAREQQLVAENRLRHARNLAASLLFDIHDAVRDLQGAAAARRKIVDSTLGQLEGLARDASDDLQLQGILAAAYERAGDLVGGLYGEGGEGTAAGLELYQKSLAIQQRLMRDPTAAGAAENWLRLANAHRRIGIVHFRNQNVKAASQSMRLALESLVAGQRRGGRWPEIEADIYHHLCVYQLSAGERETGAATCRTAIGRIQHFVSTEFTAPAARHNRAVNFQRLAALTRQDGDVAGALELLNAGIQEEARLVRENPDNASYRRTLSMMLSYLARWRDQIGGTNAIEGYRAAIESLRAARSADPGQSLLGLFHGWMAMRYSAVLHKAGRDAEARQSARESISIFEELIRAPKAGFMEFNDYASELLRCILPDLCDVQKALAHARTAVEMTNGQNAYALDTLAHAYFRTGAVFKAIDTAKLALSFAVNLPAVARDEIQSALQRFEAEAVRQEHAPD